MHEHSTDYIANLAFRSIFIIKDIGPKMYSRLIAFGHSSQEVLDGKSVYHTWFSSETVMHKATPYIVSEVQISVNRLIFTVGLGDSHISHITPPTHAVYHIP